jgi:hypothetical protein
MENKRHLFSKEDGFIVPGLYWIFYVLERISVFYVVRKVNRYFFEHRKNKDDGRVKPFTSEYVFPELWLAGNMIFAAVAPHILRASTFRAVALIIGIYSMLRVFEMLVYQINVLFFHRMNGYFHGSTQSGADQAKPAEYVIKSATRTVLMLVLNMVEYVLQFVVVFQAIHMFLGIDGVTVTVLDSFEIFMNSGSLEMYAESPLFMYAYIETVIGIFMNIVCLARFIGLLPDVKVKDE